MPVVLRDNELRAVKRHSLEGLFLLKHLNLSWNGLTQIRSDTFQAWHGMQFLQELILSHNPLAVIDDAAFFKLPSVSFLDLSATQVKSQTLLQLLQTTVSLETLQVPKDAACCLCQERPRPESPCRTIQFLCQKLCSTSALQCAQTSLLQSWGEIMDLEQGRELNIIPVLSLKPKEPSLGDGETVTLVVALTLSTEGDVSSLDRSRTNSHPPQHLLGHEGKTSAHDLRAKVQTKLHKAKSIKTAKSIFPHHPQPARLKDVVKKTPASWDHKQMEPHLNWQALKPWDVAGGLNPIHDKLVGRYLIDDLEDPAPRQNYVNSDKRPKKEFSHYWAGHNQLFYQVFSPVKAEGEHRATITKDEPRLNRNLDFLSDPLVQRGPAVSTGGGAMAEEEQSSLGGHLLIMPDTTGTHWKQQEEDSRLLNEPWSPQGPDLAPVPGDLLDAMVDRHLRLVVPDKSLQMFMAHVERALRMDCSLPQLKLVCAKMVSKTGLLLKVLSDRQENKGAYDGMGRCPLQENISRRTALEEDQEPTKKKSHHTQKMVLFVTFLSLFVIIGVFLKVFFHVRFLCREDDSHPCNSRNLCLTRFCVILQQRWRKGHEAQNVEQNRAGCPCQRRPFFLTAWASFLLKGLPLLSTFWSFSLFRKSEKPLVQCITDSYENDRKTFQEET
ncbi:leucine-rich repeat-containing protein 37B [Molothrus aeneus]|uniref:leucine-rich repeat-containing protein 37B n=1 Tax=Molothrus aeneus TaxID=84833 RepID=UPI0034593E65